MRLNLTNSAELASAIVPLAYQPNQHKAGIVHIGIGAFHRAHQAVFTHRVLEQFGGDWRIVGVSLRSAGVAQQLNPQDGLYTVTEADAATRKTYVNGAVSNVLVAPENPKAVIEQLADSSINIVTLTVTEKGYHYDNASKALNLASDDIAHDLQNPNEPISMPGYLVAGLAERKRLNRDAKLTVVSCDNLPHNGHVAQTVVTQLAQKLNPDLAAWIADHVSFCSSMVDRIVPAVTAEKRAAFENELGLKDEGMIETEPFIQWVIEDKFITQRPEWDKVGVSIVKDVSIYENIKLRTLNASHSCLAYFGLLNGHKWIHEAISDKALRARMMSMMKDEIAPTLALPDDFDLTAYQASVVARFENANIPYACAQVAMDGSLKLQQRIVPAMTERLANGAKLSPVMCELIAAWCVCLLKHNDGQSNISLSDPKIDALSQMVKENKDDPKAIFVNLCDEFSILPSSLVTNSSLFDVFSTSFQSLNTSL